MSTATHSSWADSLLDLLERQRLLVAQLAGMGESQTLLIRERRTEALLTLLGRRQQVVDQFLATHDQLSSLTANLDAGLAAVSPAVRQDIRVRLAELGEALSTITRRDEADQQQLQAARDETLDELSKVDTARAVRQAYGPAPGSAAAGAAPRFADRRG